MTSCLLKMTLCKKTNIYTYDIYYTLKEATYI